MLNKLQEQVKKLSRLANSYTIKIEAEDSEQKLKFTVSAGLVRYALASCGLGMVLFVGAFAVAAYGLCGHYGEREALQELRSVDTMQQEQVTQALRRASSLQTEMDKLEQQENELRQLLLASGNQLPVPNNFATGQGGAFNQSVLQGLDWRLGSLEQRLDVRRKSIGQLEDVLREQQQRWGKGQNAFSTIPDGLPCPGEISSPYGLRWGGSDFHPGVDIADDYGTPVYATAAGTVTYAGWNSGGYGNLVEIDHENGFETLYGHNEQVLVQEGQQVQKGEVIALMGSTGFSTGPHVHYEVTVNGERINPAKFF